MRQNKLEIKENLKKGKMIRLNSDCVHYLNLTNLQEFSNLTLISLPDGELFRMNPMILAAFCSRSSNGSFMVSLKTRIFVFKHLTIFN
jgi:hypothetical protein